MRCSLSSEAVTKPNARGARIQRYQNGQARPRVHPRSPKDRDAPHTRPDSTTDLTPLTARCSRAPSAACDGLYDSPLEAVDLQSSTGTIT